MTSKEASLALAMRKEPQAVMLTNAQITVIANTDFVPKALRGNVPAVLACVARGRAMGIPDMVALSGIAIINGKATLSAELMVAIVREHGHSITGEVSATRAVVKGKRRDNGDTMTAEFNEQMAKDAELIGKGTWAKYPDDMMWARAVSKLCRRLFADCFAGGTYAPDDMEPTADEVLDEPPPKPERIVLEVPETEIQLGRTEPQEELNLEDAPADEPEEDAPATAVSPWQQLAELARNAGIYEQLLLTAKEKFPGRTSGSLNEDECAELWRLIEMVSA